ncbi:hypothetical protein F5144DRAFT_658080 [Chaetomium tenue]|uniref:Uncharacterized protein n=1 Tax=Chaetomium tenue TaxID=1854479 RepID=A0ACB7NZ13_9PEZI|nr:hypothetical protein F5144DRAFT_658080 [Chaetomium globosum]
MCKVRIIHFSNHDGRIPIATDPFSEPGGPSDFTSSTVVDKCSCQNPIISLPPKVPGLDLYKKCDWHDCCARCYQTVKCRWFQQNTDEVPVDHRMPEEHCPNVLYISEYHPITTVLPDTTILAAPWKRWEGEDRAPYFPTAELFYSATIIDADAPNEEIVRLSRDRLDVERLGSKMRVQKAMLKAFVSLATQAVEKLEMRVDGSKGHKGLATTPEAHNFVKIVERAESLVVDTYQQMMRRSTSVLTMLDKMPEPGESLTVADGAFSISREQLDFGDLGRQDVLDACQGPLNKSKDLWKRFNDAVAALRARKRVAKKGVKGSRKGPIPANHGMKGQKKES